MALIGNKMSKRHALIYEYGHMTMIGSFTTITFTIA